MGRWTMWMASVVFFAVAPAVAQSPLRVAEEYRALVPHCLLPLLHAPEVHEELQLSSNQIVQLEALFGKLDGPWFRSRNENVDKQREILDHLDQQVHDWLSSNTTLEQRQRLRQLELRGQSVRMLLRADLAEELKLSPQQQRDFAELAKATDAAKVAIQRQAQGDDSTEALQQAATNAVKAEHDAVKSVLRSEQQQALWKSLGKSFDVTKLQRLHPMAPEFVAVEHWVNSKPLTLAELRGKVVLVHFYAFQCHNCHANFDIYRRWHEQLHEQGVVVLGIQTPETSSERDPQAVKAAARERDLQFPIMVDLKSENWKAWGNTMWPTVYMVDKKGYLRHVWQGELNWKGATADKTIEQIVERVLAEP